MRDDCLAILFPVCRRDKRVLFVGWFEERVLERGVPSLVSCDTIGRRSVVCGGF